MRKTPRKLAASCMAATILAAGAWASPGDDHKASRPRQAPSPSIYSKGCTATLGKMNFGIRTKTWITSNPPYKGVYSGWWKYTWAWNYSFSCGDGQTSLCAVCDYQEVDYFNTTNNQWIVAYQGRTPNELHPGDCNTTTTITATSSFDYPYKTGTELRATWAFAVVDPSISSDCVGQDYVEPGGESWYIEPNGP